MKRKIFTVLAACGLVGMTMPACSDFLEEDNKVGETADLSYSTENGVLGLIGNCYSFARGWYGKEAALGLSEMGTDLFYYGYDNKQKSLCQYIITSAALENNTSDNPCLDHYWEMFYCAIDACNNALVQIDKCSELSETKKQQYAAEIHFLRGFYYFHIVNIWGAAPYNDSPVTSINLAPTRMSESELYGKILEDLDQSIDLFDKAGYNKKTDGRANYWAARGIKARVLLYAASWLNGQLGKQIEGNSNYSSMGGQQLYAAAQAEAEAVIGASDYASLYSNYSDVWTMANEGYEENKEAIFGVTYSQDIATTVNCIPKRYRENNGTPMDYNSLITRTGYSRGGSAMLLMFVSMWNNGCGDLGGNGQKNTNVFFRVAAGKTTIKSKTTGEDVEVGAAYSPYGRGFTRYVPSLRLWQLLEAHRATDQRTEATLLDHYDLASPDLAGNVAGNYPNIKDTAIYYCPLDGNSPEGQAKQAWAKDRYRIQFAYNGDIPVFTSGDLASAVPTEKAKEVSDVYGDKRYNDAKIGGNRSFPGIKKFLDDIYDPNYPTWDISSRDAIVMRESELYLIKAEAQLAQNNAGAALATINELRTARAISGTDNTLSGTCDLDMILDERAIELCGEQMRWFDLRRTGKLIEYVKKYNAQAAGNIDEHHLYRPIPQTELDAVTNLGNGFSQNPGY